MDAVSDLENVTLALAARLPFVSIVIPTFERDHLLCETMRLALSQDYPCYEVIVVDQTPHVSDEVASLVESADARLTYLQSETPNLPAARNAGVAVARGDVIVFIDDDVLIGPEYIRGHARRYADPSVGAVMGLTLAVDESDEPGAVQSALALFGLIRQMPDGAFQVRSVVGCNSSYRREALVRAGLSDERFAGCGEGEDTDLSFRVGRLGFDLVYDPSVRLTHLSARIGGCAARDPANEHRFHDERCLLHLFLLLKHRVMFGFQRTSAEMWGAYRWYTLNRSTVRSPLRLLHRHWRFFEHFLKASWMLRFQNPHHVTIASRKRAPFVSVAIPHTIGNRCRLTRSKWRSTIPTRARRPLVSR